jgi:hypothetical protein
MNPVFLFVARTAAGIMNRLPSLRPVCKKTADTAWGPGVVTRDLARPRASRYRFSGSMLMIGVGLGGLVKVVGR